MRERAVVTPTGRFRSRRGASIVEMVATFLILAFVTSGTAGLYYVGTRQQRGSRFYTEAQTDLREGIRRITRTVRHGSAVLTGTTFPSADSNSAQVIVAVPQASPRDKIRIYRNASSGTIYAQTSGDAASASAGTVMLAGPATLSITYYRTGATSTGTTTTDVTSSGPATATEVQLTLSTTRGSVTTTSVAYVQLRNANFGF